MILSKIKILRSHGSQWIRDLSGATIPEPYRGCPVISPVVPPRTAAKLTGLCPTGAIAFDGGLTLDLGRCLFCGQCEIASPASVRFTTNFRMAASRREDLVITAQSDGMVPFDRSAVRESLHGFFDHALKLRQVSAGGDNSCEMELNASQNVNFDLPRYGIEFVASPRHADGVVVTGPVTAAMANPLQICYDAMPEPKVVIAVGVDAISGGLFDGSPALDRSFFDRHPADLYVPGNPAHPLSFIDGVMKLCGRDPDQ